MNVGERLKAVREAKNLSQGDIEKQTGLLRCYVSRCEHGYTVPNLVTLEKWTRALDINLSQLFAEDGEAAPLLPALKAQPASKLGRKAALHLHRIEQAFAQMSSRDMELVEGMARKLARSAKSR